MPFPTSLSPSLLLRPAASSLLLRRRLLPPLHARHPHRHRRRRRFLLLSSSSSSSYCSSSLRPFLKHPLSTMSPSSSSSSSSSSSPSSLTLTPTSNPNPNTTTRARKKAYRESPEGVLRRDLDLCSKRGDLAEALRLYDSARASFVPLSLHHYNVLLYLCSSPSSSSSSSSSSPSDLGLDRGFEILRHMAADPSVAPNEATFTSAARLAAARRDPALAFDLVRRMAAAGVPPRLRSYGPALFGFCDAGDLAGARAVEAHMAAAGVAPEDPELAALLAASARAGDGAGVYRVLHRLRSLVRVVSERTAEIAESWFGSDAAAEAGVEEWDEGKVREGAAKGGGGWHGQGWLGKGPWSLDRSEMDEDGVCRRCGERLVCIDIDPSETEDFAKSLAALASQREVKAYFLGFQEWLERNGPFDAVIDAANVGLYNQKNFSFFQLNSVVNGMRQMSRSNKLPLIILHSRRIKGGPADAPNNKKLIESWRRAGALYATPPGSNDDWYWLYAAVSCRSLVVTNDEMRDHLFQLLGTSFFPRWKEKHQVRLTFSRRGPAFHMPPPYSRVIQESEGGSWHIPTLIGDDIEEPRQWVCATRNTIRASSRPPLRLSQMGW